MSDAMSVAELDEQHVELLPARTVLSLFSAAGGGRGGNAGQGGTGGVGKGGLLGLDLANVNAFGEQYNTVASGFGGAAGSADGGGGGAYR